MNQAKPKTLFLIKNIISPIRKLQDMVSPRLIAAELLKKRKTDKSREKSTSVNTADLQILGSSCQGVRPSLLVNSGGKTYLFNCSEGTQRNCYSNKVKLTNLEHLFITRSNWSNISGAYGLSLTLQDIGVPSFTIHSSEAVSGFFDSVQSFLNFTTGIDCKTNDCVGTELKDSNIHVRCIALDKELTDGSNLSKKAKKLPTLIAYSCMLPDLPGTLDPKRCRELNVPVGPQLALLKSGLDVTLEDGTVVKSSDVCGPKSMGPNIIVVECPTDRDIHSVTGNQELDQLRRNRSTNDERQIDLVVHFSPESVTANHLYKQWMDGFSEDCKHILLLNSEVKRPNFIDSYRLQFLLGRLDPNIFAPLRLPAKLSTIIDSEIVNELDSLNNSFPDPDETILKTISGGDLKDQSRIINASAFDRFLLRPRKIFEFIEPRLSIDAMYKNAKFQIDFEEAFTRYRAATADLPSPEAHEPEIVFLGTGSAMPSKLRNTSCILINFYVPRRVSIILDCGEDSYGQIVRYYGPTKAKEILKNLKMIYVSHHHPDHHIGLIEILRQRMNITGCEAIQLLVPPGIDLHLNYYNNNYEDLSKTYALIDTKNLKRVSTKRIDKNNVATSVVGTLSGLLENIALVAVEHCANSCAIVMDFNINRPGMSKFRLAYSGDARPSEQFASLGLDCDLLIHEATFDHKEEESALEKKHSTTTEAIQISKKMNAKFTILTHFSQKYPKIPYFTDEFDDTIGYAFDNMSIRCPSQLIRLPLMKNLLKVVFSKSLREIDVRHVKLDSKRKTISNICKSQL